MRKTLLFTLIIFTSYIIVQAQQLRLIVQPNTDPPVLLQDTLWIGFHSEATAGIDTVLGEEDISNRPPFGNLDTRVVQRDINQPICSYTDQPDTYFDTPEHSFDSKINYRSINNNALANRIFQIQIRAIGSHLLFSFDSESLLSEIIDEVYISTDSCEILPSVIDSSFFALNDSLGFGSGIATENAKYITIIFKENLFTSTEKPYPIANNLKTFPNPVSDYLIIEDHDMINAEILITNLMGQIMPLNGIKQDKQYRVNTNDWPPGSYFIILKNKEGVPIKSGKVVKL